jgi:transcriptional regulator with XRE-family HTH domain
MAEDHASTMDQSRIGRTLRAIRLGARSTQEAVAKQAGVSQSVYSRAERGGVPELMLATLERIVSALGGRLVVDIHYQGGRADRLLDRAHAAIVEVVIATLQAAGWETRVDFSFNVFGERGSVDILGWHVATRTLLIVEVKSRFTDLQAMLLSLGRKLRLVPEEVRLQIGWDPIAVGRIVVASGTTENRNVISQHRSTFGATLPAGAKEIRRVDPRSERPDRGRVAPIERRAPWPRELTPAALRSFPVGLGSRHGGRNRPDPRPGRSQADYPRRNRRALTPT